MPHEVFISYSNHDKAIAVQVCDALEAEGLTCWIAPRNILPGVDYGKALVSAIYSAKVFVLILSTNSNTSSHVLKETERAISRGVPMIPLRIEDVKLSQSMEYYLSSVQWLLAANPPTKKHIDLLIQTTRKLIEHPDSVRLSQPMIREVGKVEEKADVNIESTPPTPTNESPVPVQQPDEPISQPHAEAVLQPEFPEPEVGSRYDWGCIIGAAILGVLGIVMLGVMGVILYLIF